MFYLKCNKCITSIAILLMAFLSAVTLTAFWAYDIITFFEWIVPFVLMVIVMFGASDQPVRARNMGSHGGCYK